MIQIFGTDDAEHRVLIIDDITATIDHGAPRPEIGGFASGAAIKVVPGKPHHVSLIEGIPVAQLQDLTTLKLVSADEAHSIFFALTTLATQVPPKQAQVITALLERIALMLNAYTFVGVPEDV